VDLLTLGETIAVTGLARRTLFRARERNEFPPSVKIGASRTIFFRADEIDAWCAAHGLEPAKRVT
jgi:predicted DNA-binding transcriptional regulator AlpA